jgi:hypothetical protein
MLAVERLGEIAVVVLDHVAPAARADRDDPQGSTFWRS